MQRMKDMFNDLNQLLEMREAGQDTDQKFQEFMERFGDFFPDNPQNLDELLESLAQRMAGTVAERAVAGLRDDPAGRVTSASSPDGVSRLYRYEDPGHPSFLTGLADMLRAQLAPAGHPHAHP